LAKHDAGVRAQVHFLHLRHGTLRPPVQAFVDWLRAEAG
jgi:hypothetical protein